jgi:hypothetical protein
MRPETSGAVSVKLGKDSEACDAVVTIGRPLPRVDRDSRRVVLVLVLSARLSCPAPPEPW